ncbi:hypothetical protein GGR57DRAFT_218009 [Xylariaceae sp. FL1272]|nr:hypothetical protein GGR57DRAFT_218009 [Xylariaceae sp. FL1272]
MGSKDEVDFASLPQERREGLGFALLSQVTVRTRNNLGRLQEHFDRMFKDLRDEHQELNTRILGLKDDLLQHADQNHAYIIEKMRKIESDSEDLKRLVNGLYDDTSVIKSTQQSLESNLDDKTNQIQSLFTLIDSTLGPLKNGIEQLLDQERENRSATLRDHAALKASITDLAKVIKQDKTSQTTELKRHMDAVLGQKSVKECRQDILINADQMQRLEAFETVMGTVMKASRGRCDHKDVTEGREGLEDARVFIRTYSLLSSYYKILHAKGGQTDHHMVITYFLQLLNQHASCHLQRRLLELCPEKVKEAKLPKSSNPPRIFIEYEGLVWHQVKHVVHNLGGLKRLQVAVNEQWTGPAQMSKKRKRTSADSSIDMLTHDETTIAKDNPPSTMRTVVEFTDAAGSRKPTHKYQADQHLPSPKNADSDDRKRSLRRGERVDYKPPRRLAEWVRSDDGRN